MDSYTYYKYREHFRKNVRPFVLALVDNFVDLNGNDRSMSLNDVSENDVSKLASILSAEDPCELTEVIWNESTYSLMTIALRTCEKEDLEILASKQTKNLIKHFEKRMDQIVKDVHEEFVQLNKQEYKDEHYEI